MSFSDSSASRAGLGSIREALCITETLERLRGKPYNEGPNITMCHQAKDGPEGHSGCQSHSQLPFLGHFQSRWGLRQGSGRPVRCREGCGHQSCVYT